MAALRTALLLPTNGYHFGPANGNYEIIFFQIVFSHFNKSVNEKKYVSFSFYTKSLLYFISNSQFTE